MMTPLNKERTTAETNKKPNRMTTSQGNSPLKYHRAKKAISEVKDLT